MVAGQADTAPDPDAVASMINHLRALELRDTREFAETLVTNILDPDPVETAAFRSDELAYLSFVATRWLIDNAKDVRARKRRGSQKERATDAYIRLVGRERRVLEQIVSGLRAKNGVLPAAPNPRRRAERRLWSLAMKGEAIPAGMWRVILEEEIVRDRSRKRDQKRSRQTARRGSAPTTRN